MSPVTTPRAPRRRRTKVLLPRDLGERFVRLCAERGTDGPTLVYGWVVQAARYARERRYDLVPARSTYGQSSGDQYPLQYSQSKAESAECARLLQDVGSSVRAVAVACATAYIAASGDPLVMAWPTREPPGERPLPAFPAA